MASFVDTTSVDGELLKRDISYKDSQDLYREWAETGTYDSMLRDRPQDYNGLFMFTDGMDRMFTDKTSVRVLDVGAGTGLSGEKLRSLGYTKVDGLEPCDKFVDIIRNKGIYDIIFDVPIGGDTPIGVTRDTYDAICVVGCFGPGHIPCSAVPEMVRLVKPGGYILNCMRHSFIDEVEEYKGKLIPLFERLEAEGKLKKIEWTIYPNHFAGKDGVRMVYKVL